MTSANSATDCPGVSASIYVDHRSAPYDRFERAVALEYPCAAGRHEGIREQGLELGGTTRPAVWTRIPIRAAVRDRRVATPGDCRERRGRARSAPRHGSSVPERVKFAPVSLSRMGFTLMLSFEMFPVASGTV